MRGQLLMLALSRSVVAHCSLSALEVLVQGSSWFGALQYLQGLLRMQTMMCWL